MASITDNVTPIVDETLICLQHMFSKERFTLNQTFFMDDGGPSLLKMATDSYLSLLSYYGYCDCRGFVVL